MTTTRIEDLGEKIERLVEEHIAASRAAAAAAVQRGFGVKVQAPARAGRRPKLAKAGAKRRTGQALAELAERFYAAVVGSPGQPMGILAEKVGATPRELHRSMSALKRAGRLRSAGERSNTRYFPATGGAKASA